MKLFCNVNSKLPHNQFFFIRIDVFFKEESSIIHNNADYNIKLLALFLRFVRLINLTQDKGRPIS